MTLTIGGKGGLQDQIFGLKKICTLRESMPRHAAQRSSLCLDALTYLGGLRALGHTLLYKGTRTYPFCIRQSSTLSVICCPTIRSTENYTSRDIEHN